MNKDQEREEYKRALELIVNNNLDRYQIVRLAQAVLDKYDDQD